MSIKTYKEFGYKTEKGKPNRKVGTQSHGSKAFAMIAGLP